MELYWYTRGEELCQLFCKILLNLLTWASVEPPCASLRELERTMARRSWPGHACPRSSGSVAGAVCRCAVWQE